MTKTSLIDAMVGWIGRGGVGIALVAALQASSLSSYAADASLAADGSPVAVTETKVETAAETRAQTKVDPNGSQAIVDALAARGSDRGR